MPASSERDGAQGEREGETERDESLPLCHARSLHTKLNRRDINLTFSLQRPSSFFHWHELQSRAQPQLHVVNFIPPLFHNCMRSEGRLNPFWKLGANTIRVSIEKREGRKQGRKGGRMRGESASSSNQLTPICISRLLFLQIREMHSRF